MKQDRNVPQTRGYRLTPKAVRTIQEISPAPFQFTHEGAAILQDHKRGLIAADVNILQVEQRQKIDAIIAEIRAPKPAPTKCWDCGCKTISIKDSINNRPAYICALCNLWLGDVNPEINVKFELIGKHENLIWELGRIPLSDDAKFQETLETIRLIHAEILSMESK